MMEKVRLTQEQLEALEIYKANSGKGLGWMQYFAVAKEDFNGLYSSLKPLTLDEMARLLYEPDSFEVEEEFKVGDWKKVVLLNGKWAIGQIDTLAFDDIIFNYLDENTEWQRVRQPAKASVDPTPEEIKAEKERRVWAGIDREVNEWRKGDVYVHRRYAEVFAIDHKDALRLASERYEEGLVIGIYPYESFISFGGESHDN